MDSIKEYWEKFKAVCRNENVIFGFPATVLTVILIAEKNFLVLIALVLWFLVIIANTNEKE